MKQNLIGVMATAIFVCISMAAIAQLSNQPFSFGNAPGGLGMSMGGRQAIINQKLYGQTPQNLVRGPDGFLLSVTKGTGDMPLVVLPGTSIVIPGYRGLSFTGGNSMMAAGVFNAFFVPTQSGLALCCFTPADADSATISTWTLRVVTNGSGIYYDNNNIIDVWTGQVFSLNGLSSKK